MNFVRSASLLFASAVSPEQPAVGVYATDQTPLLRCVDVSDHKACALLMTKMKEDRRVIQQQMAHASPSSK
uniref:Secreted protein n=1 Tax=Plectus sambesii TaxID=2011161 RepID=A0A914WLC4_9BILA